PRRTGGPPCPRRRRRPAPRRPARGHRAQAAPGARPPGRAPGPARPAAPPADEPAVTAQTTARAADGSSPVSGARRSRRSGHPQDDAAYASDVEPETDSPSRTAAALTSTVPAAIPTERVVNA